MARAMGRPMIQPAKMQSAKIASSILFPISWFGLRRAVPRRHEVHYTQTSVFAKGFLVYKTKKYVYPRKRGMPHI